MENAGFVNCPRLKSFFDVERSVHISINPDTAGRTNTYRSSEFYVTVIVSTAATTKLVMCAVLSTASLLRINDPGGCSSCNSSLDRDHNAAINIQQLGSKSSSNSVA